MNIEQALSLSRESSIDKFYFDFHRDRFAVLLKHIEAEKLDKKKARVLDIGFHELQLLSSLHHLQYANLYGSDIELFHAQDSTLKLSKQFSITLNICDFSCDSLPYTNDFFDAICFSEVLEHLPFHPLETVKELYRVLKPNGKLIISTPNFLRLGNRIKLLLGKEVLTSLREGPGAHFREYSRREVIELVELAGFSKINCQSINLFGDDTFFEKISKILCSYITKNLNNTLLLECIK